ncbi:MAG: FAD:protein FMN transferase, partial [Bacteroidota bacterium]
MRYTISLVLICLLASCSTTPQQKQSAASRYQKVQGKTMGTTYNVTYRGKAGKQAAIDSVLSVVNKDVNTYDPKSTISLFNQAQVGSDLSEKRHRHFINNYKTAVQVAKATQGAFDPTVMPLVNYWGFGYTPKKPVTKVDSLAVDSLLQLVGLDKISYRNTILQKTIPAVQLDFSALAKGYGVDEIGRMLEADSIQNYMVEIGGEVRARGVNSKGKAWTIGINRPAEGAATSDLQASLALKNQSVATSGNYRNFYEIDGVKYSHT